ncbi:membrane hypothetical protein [Candidatus Zixiibacteriota bacterium]|nr:membrane hypothetical protein [candidate division Zixibacteria bacterium]
MGNCPKLDERPAVKEKDNHIFWILNYSLVFLYLLHLVPFALHNARLWGLNHLVFLPPGFTIVYSILGILTLGLIFIPAVREKGNAIFNFTASLLFESRHKYLARVLVIVIAGVTFSIFPMPTHFLGDGYQYLENIGSSSGTFVKWSEMGVALIVLGLQSLIGPKSPENALLAFRIVAVLSGIITIWFYFLIAEIMSGDRTYRLIVFIISLLSGSLLLFFGYVEFYPLLWPAVTGFIYYGLKYIKKGAGLPGCLTFLLGGLVIHLIMAVFIPSFAYLAIFTGKGAIIYRRLRKLVWVVILTAVAVCLAAVIYKFKTDLGFENIFLPLFQGKSINPSYALISLPHLIDIVNLLLLLSPLLPVMILVLIFYRERNLSRSEFIYLGWAAAGTILFLFVIDPSLTMPRDWDLFSLSAFPITLLILLAIKPVGRTLISGLSSTILVALIAFTMPFIVTNLRTDSSIAYVSSFVNEDRAKSMGTVFNLKVYYDRIGDTARADSINHELNLHYRDLVLINQALKAVYDNDMKTANNLIPLITPNEFSKDYHLLLGMYYLNIRKTDFALIEIRKAIQLQPYYYKSYLDLAIAYMAQRNRAKSIESLKEALKLKNNDSEVLFVLASAYLGEGQADSCEFYSRNLLRVDSNYFPVYYLLARAAIIKGSKSDAERWSEIFIEKGTGSPGYDMQKNELLKMLGDSIKVK